MKNLKTIAVVLFVSMFLTSCYSYTSVVGAGPEKYKKESAVNHYFFYGLVPAKMSDSKRMASGVTNYQVHTRQTFLNGLVAGLTFGIYTPTKTTVTW